MSDILVNLFGDKPWYKSLTAWAVFVFAVGQTYCNVGSGECAVGVVECVDALPFASAVCKLSLTVAPILGTLGLRRAANPVEYEDE